MSGALFILQIVLVVILVILVLLQKSSSMGLGAYSSSNDSLFGAGGPMNFLTKATITIGLAFILNTLALGYLYNQQASQSAWDKVKQSQPPVSHPSNSTTPSIPQIPSVPQ